MKTKKNGVILIAFTLSLSVFSACTNTEVTNTAPKTSLSAITATNTSPLPTSTGNTPPPTITTTTTTTPTSTTATATITTTPIAKTTSTPINPTPTTSFLSYTNKAFYYRISYPQYPVYFQINESDPAAVTIDNAATGGITILVDKVPANSIAKSYFDAISQGKKQQLPTWSCSNVTEIKEDGTVVGYKYDYSNTVSNKNWIGRGMVYKKAGLGFYVVYTTPEENWSANKEWASTCIDSFVPPKLTTGKYTNSKFGYSLNLPTDWSLYETNSNIELLPVLVLYLPSGKAAISSGFYVRTVPSGTTAEELIKYSLSGGLNLGRIRVDYQGAFTFSNGAIGYKAVDTMLVPGYDMKTVSIAIVKGNCAYEFIFSDTIANVDAALNIIDQMAKTLVVSTDSDTMI